MSGRIINLASHMRGRASCAAGPRARVPQIRIAPAIGIDKIGEWEWAVFEEQRATTAGELAEAQASRTILANGLERSALAAALAAINGLEQVTLASRKDETP